MSMARDYLRRVALLLGGLALSALGVAMTIQANVGLEPWSVLHQGLSLFFHISYGTAAMLTGVGVIVIAIACGESFGLGTLGNIFICPVMIDGILYLNVIPKMQGLLPGIAMLIAGLEILAIGTLFYMKSALGSGPRDALMVALARRTKQAEGMCRAVLDVLTTAIGYFLGGQVGVGTLISALGLGALIHLTFGAAHFRATQVHQENLPETLRRLRGGT